jgi:hypothetical protein
MRFLKRISDQELSAWKKNHTAISLFSGYGGGPKQTVAEAVREEDDDIKPEDLPFPLMDKEITEHVVKLSGKATLLELINLSHNYKVQVDGSVIETTDADNQDDTFTRYCKFKPVLVSVIKESGEIIKAKDIRSRSQQLRAAIFKEWTAANIAAAFEDYYDAEMVKLIPGRNIF